MAEKQAERARFSENRTERRFFAPKNSSGFTLVEILIAFMILGVAAISAIGLLTRAARISENNREKLLALQTAQSILEVVKNTPLRNIQGIETAGTVPADLNRGAVAIETEPENPAAEPLATVTVIVSWWDSANRPQQLRLSTLRSQF